MCVRAGEEHSGALIHYSWMSRWFLPTGGGIVPVNRLVTFYCDEKNTGLPQIREDRSEYQSLSMRIDPKTGTFGIGSVDILVLICAPLLKKKVSNRSRTIKVSET